MKSYCVKCRKNTENLNSKIFKTKHGRLQPDSNPEPLSSKMQSLSTYNKGIKYLLCAIDLFTNYAMVVPFR